MKKTDQNIDKQQELELLRREVDLLKNRLKKSEDFKHTFLSNLRNEIVNPISGILGLSSNLVNRQISKDEEESTRKMMILIYEEVFNLHYHLASFLQAADIESGESRISVSTIDIEPLISSIKGELKPLLDKKNCELVYQIDQQEKFHADRDKLKLILLVFAQHILQLDQNPSTIEIQCEANSEQRKFKIYAKSVLEVLDTLHKQEEELLNSVQDIKISMAKTVIEMMGGRLQVIEEKSSVIGFWFTLDNGKHDEEEDSEMDDIIF